MNRFSMQCCRVLTCGLLVLLVGVSGGVSSAAPVPVDDAADAAEVRATKYYQRYLSQLLRRPRRGTAMDKVYSFHVDRGTLDSFVSDLKMRAVAADADGSARLVLGMIERRRGQNDAARADFETAVKLRPDDAVAGWYLGETLADLGDNAAAAKALELALQAEPAKADLADIFEQLGRLYQRTQQHEKTLDTWTRFEAAFPGDQRIRMLIAQSLADEGRTDAALQRFRSLMNELSDPYQRLQAGLKAAELTLEAGRRDNAIELYEAQLSRLKPGSWQIDGVRDRIEDAFLTTDDNAGLIAYYETRLKQRPDELDSMARLATRMARQNDHSGAIEWLGKAIAKSPSTRSLRDLLIRQLIAIEDFDAAFQQFEELARLTDDDSEVLAEWGRLHLRDERDTQQRRQQKASAVWQRLLQQGADDPVHVTQVADLYRAAGMPDDAIPLFERAISLAPGNLQYVEYLGEYLHSLNRPDAAITTFRRMATGDRRTTENLGRLSNTLAKFSYREQAIAAMLAACELTPEFSDYVKLAELFRNAGEFGGSREQLKLAEPLAESVAEEDQLWQQHLQTDLAAGQLATRVQELQQQVDAGGAESTEQLWQTLARYQEAAGNLRDAAHSIQQAVKVAPDSMGSWTVAAQIMEHAGLLGKASEAHRQLAEMDRRNRMKHLQRVAELEQQLGRNENALQAAEELMAAAPNNPEAFRVYSELSLRLGRPEAALLALRNSVRVNPSDVRSLKLLGTTLADQFETDAAIDVLWRAFEQSDDQQDRISIVRQLTELYLRTNRFDQLVSRLQALADREDRRDDVLRCLASAYQETGDDVSARQTLEELLRDNPRDQTLLQDIVAQAERTQLFPVAVKYQRQLVDIHSSEQNLLLLAQLELLADQTDAMLNTFGRINANSEATTGILRAMDQLMLNGRHHVAEALGYQWLLKDTNSWQTMLRLAVIHWSLEQPDLAVTYCERLLELSPPPLEPATSGNQRPTPIERTFAAQRVLHHLHLRSRLPDSIPAERIAWSAPTFLSARTAAVFLKFQRLDDKQVPKYVRGLIESAATGDNNSAWDALAAVEAGQHQQDYLPALMSIFSEIDEPAAQWVVLHLAVTHDQTSLVKSHADDIHRAYRAVSHARPEWLEAVGGVTAVLQVLKSSGFEGHAAELRNSLAADDATPVQLAAALQIAFHDGDLDTILTLLDRSVAAERPSSGVMSAADDDTFGQLAWTFGRLMSRKVADGAFDDVATITSQFLRLKTQAIPRQSRIRPDDVNAFTVTSSQRMFQNGRQSNSRRVTTLPADRYWTARDINFFANLYELNKGERWQDVLAVVTECRSQSSGRAAVMAEIALAHLYVLNGDRNSAAVHLVRAAELAPQEGGLRIRLAWFYVESGNDSEALALLDTVSAFDQDLMRQRELLALELSTKTASTARAKLAAERLFGLRLDSDTSIRLAGQMRTLGLTQMADTLLQRVRNTPSNELQTLVSLLDQYIAQKDHDTASQIAMQLLQETDIGSRRSAAAEAARKSAASALKQTGQLNSLIARTEQQLASSPDSTELQRDLIDFYRAADRHEDAVRMSSKLSAQEPESIDNLLRLATQYERVRQFDEACTQYLLVLKRDPQRFTQNYYQYLRTFQNARRLPELADVLLTVDIRKLNNNYYVVGETIEHLFAAAATESRTRNDGHELNANRTSGLELLAAAWQAFPNDRSFLLNKIRDPNIWNLPVMFQYAKEGMIPLTPQQAIARPWQGIADSPSFDSSGRIQGTLSRVLRAMPGDQQRIAFMKEVETAVQKFPTWHGGKLILSVLKARSGDHAAAQQLAEDLLSNAEVEFVPTQTAWLVGAELERHGDEFVRLSADMLFEALQKEGFVPDQGYERSAGRRLAELYHRIGDKVAARVAVMQTLHAADSATFNEAGRKSWQHLTDRSVASRDLIEMSAPFDGIRVLQQMTNEILVDSEQYRNDGTGYRMLREARERERRTLNSITAENVVNYLRRWQQGGDASSREFDLLLSAPPAGSIVADRNSVVLSVLQSRKLVADQSVVAALQNLLDERSADPAITVAAFTFAEASDNSELRNAAVQRLKELSSDQQSEPSPQSVALWFSARSLLSSMATNAPLANQLADKAEAAASLHNRSLWHQAILKERGQLALAAGDKAAAERAWSEQLDVILGRPDDDDASDQQNSQSGTSAVRELRERLLQPQP